MLSMLTILSMNNAFALDCFYAPKTWPSWPSWSEESDLPLNTKPLIVYEVYSLEEFPMSLNMDDGSPIETQILELDARAFHLQPTELLSPNQSFTYKDLDFGYIETIFSTADFIDDEAPLTPVLSNMERSVETDEWGVWDYLMIAFEDQGDEPKYYRTEFSDNPAFENSVVVWEIPNGDTLSIGHDPACTNELTSEQMDSWNNIRVVAFDAAGNSSDSLTFVNQLEHAHGEAEVDKETGCSSTANSTIANSTMGIWALLSVVALRRKG
jgi:hypothetical protein